MRRAALLLLALACTGAASRARGFDFDSLQQLIRSRNIGTIEQLLAALPATQRSHYTLMFESRSLQGASLKSPRAIVFGPDARFILTFNGDPAQRGYRTLETMEFDAAARQFRLRELEFAADGGAPLVSAVNPERCARCHGTPARPVWDTFPLWPGAYGERYRAHLSARERSGLASFLAAQPTHPRYRQLLYSERYADAQTFRPSAVSLYSGSVQEPPNAELSLALTRLQAQAITRELEQQPAFAAYRYALLGLADDACGALAEFYPEPLWRAQRAAFARFATDTVAANSRQAQLKAQRSGAATHPQPNAALLQLRFVAESALGVSSRAWTLALEQGTYDFSMPPLSPQPLRETLLRSLASDDPALRELSDTSTSADGDRYCSYLQRRSRAALAAAAGAQLLTGTPQQATAPAAAAAPIAAAAPPSLQLCIACHESGVAPPLPFSDAAQLSRQLHARSTPHGALLDEIRFRLSAAAGAQRMPLGLNLSEADRASLERYFAALASSPN